VAEVEVTLLECSGCGAPLDGLRMDSVFTCLECRRGHVIEGGAVRVVPVSFGSVSVDTALPVAYLPFWRLEIGVEVGGASLERLAAIEERGVPSVVWVPAFFVTRTSFFGDPGMDLTVGAAEVLEVEEIPAGARLVGATRTPTLAAEYARLMVTELIDRGGDVTGLEIDVPVDGVRLWGLPFGVDAAGGALVDLTGGMTYSTSIAEDLEEILNV